MENVFTFDMDKGEGGKKMGDGKAEEQKEMEVLNVTCFIMMLDLLLRQVSIGFDFCASLFTITLTDSVLLRL